MPFIFNNSINRAKSSWAIKMMAGPRRQIISLVSSQLSMNARRSPKGKVSSAIRKGTRYRRRMKRAEASGGFSGRPPSSSLSDSWQATSSPTLCLCWNYNLNIYALILMVRSIHAKIVSSAERIYLIASIIQIKLHLRIGFKISIWLALQIPKLDCWAQCTSLVGR